jgi:TolA-binding protein
VTSDPGGDRALRELHAALPPAGPHPDDEIWVRLADGTLDARARHELAAHVVSCESCAEVYRAMTALRAGAPDEVTGATGSGSARRVSLAWLAAAAAVALAVSAAVVQWRDAGEHLATEAPATAAVDMAPATPAPDAEAPAPDAAPPATPAPPAPRAWALSVAAPAVELPARYVLTMRGDAVSQAFLEAFGTAIAPYRDGRYGEAAMLLEPVARQYADRPEAAFYLGVSQLMAGDAPRAAQTLAGVRDAEDLSDAARWFEAVALERAGHSEAAGTLLEALCAGAGDYAPRACAAISTPAGSR